MELSDDMLREIGRVAVAATNLESRVALVRYTLTDPLEQVKILATGRLPEWNEGRAYRSESEQVPPLPVEIIMADDAGKTIAWIKDRAATTLDHRRDLLSELRKWLGCVR